MYTVSSALHIAMTLVSTLNMRATTDYIHNYIQLHTIYIYIYISIPVAPRSKAYVYGRSLTEIVGSNPTADMDGCLLGVLCVVR